MKDDTAFVQNILASRNAFLPAGDYACKTLTLPSYTTFHGDGKEVSRIYAHPDMDPAAPMLQNTSGRATTIRRIGFYDKVRPDRSSAALSFSETYEPEFEGIGVYDSAYMGIALADTYNAQIKGGAVMGCGTGVWVGSMGRGNIGAKIISVDFRDTRASPISIAGSNKDCRTQGAIVDDCTMYRVGENAIYVNPWTLDTTISNCKIDTVRRDDVLGDNGTGVEVQGEGLKFIDNTVRNIDWSCLLLFQPRSAIIRGNTFSNPGQNLRHMEPGNDISACIRFNSLGVNSVWQPPDGPYKQPTNIIVDGNICEDNVAGGHYGIVFQGEDDCLLFNAVTLVNNVTLGSKWVTPTGLMVKTTRIKNVTHSVWAAACSAKNNIGFKDRQLGAIA